MILIPYHEPFGRIASLNRQHINFLKVPAANTFTLRYAETIGHFEFGRPLRPIDFDGWLENAADLDPKETNFWSAYRIAAFEAIGRPVGERAVIFSYDRLCAKPTVGLAALELS